MKRLLTSLILLSICSAAWAIELDSEQQQNIKYRQQCLEIRDFLVQGNYSVDCHYNYHHYNGTPKKSYYSAKAVKERGQIKIAGFNLWHPGSTKTLYKDYQIVAQAIDQWDLVGATELLPVIGDDLKNNEAIIKFLNDGPKLIEKIKSDIAALKLKRGTAAQQKLIESKMQELTQLTADLEEAPALYRAPGYLLLLNQLRKLDPSWSLILAPRGEAAKETDVQELSGYFYRGKVVRPVVNDYCYDQRTNGEGTPVACIPTFSEHFMGKDYRHVFSRRPLIASFESGKFDFTLLTTHIVFNSPTANEEAASILNTVFGNADLNALGTGINNATYARFAETTTILRFMDLLRRFYREQDLILIGDFNLESNNAFWKNVLPEMPGAELLVNEATSITLQRVAGNGKETNGHASNYDHFILDPQVTKACDTSSAKRVSIVDGYIGQLVDQRYKIRGDVADSEGKFPIIDKDKIDALRQNLWNNFQNRKTIVRNKIVANTEDSEKRILDFDRRVFIDQQFDQTYYRMYMEAVSDHSPIEMTCATN